MCAYKNMERQLKEDEQTTIMAINSDILDIELKMRILEEHQKMRDICGYEKIDIDKILKEITDNEIKNIVKIERVAIANEVFGINENTNVEYRWFDKEKGDFFAYKYLKDGQFNLVLTDMAPHSVNDAYRSMTNVYYLTSGSLLSKVKSGLDREIKVVDLKDLISVKKQGKHIKYDLREIYLGKADKDSTHTHYITNDKNKLKDQLKEENKLKRGQYLRFKDTPSNWE